jgi:[acyl-carrier-protein] S-malonyltransferase
MTLAILCSGQGAQHANMFDLLEGAAAAQPVLAAAGAQMGRDIVPWVRTATPSQLRSNATAQLLCCTQALAMWQVLSLPGDRDCVLAGYSVGELASWGCAGLLPPAEVLRLAGLRANAMDAAAGADTGLLSVRGLQRAPLTALCREHDCEIAIVLADDQYIVGGPLGRLRTLAEVAPRSGAQRVTVVPVSVASHTSRLAAASTVFLEQLEASAVRPAPPRGIRLLSGIDGDSVGDVSAGLTKLAQQISHTLDWQACLTACAEAGVSQVLELGPGRALAAMAREAIPGARCRSVDEFRTLAGIHAWLADGTQR